MIRVKADVTIKPEAIRTIIEQHYDVDVQKLERVRGVYKVTTTGGEYGFKNAEELPDLPFIADCLHQIREHGFERIPTLFPSKRGTLIVQEHGESYFMEKWLDLKEVPRRSFPYMPAIGRALADFHKATYALTPPKQSDPRYQWGKRQERLEADLLQLRRWSEQPAATPWNSEQALLHFLYERCQRAYDSIKSVDPSAFTPVWTHAGLHHKNIMLDKEKNIWFIDFETMTYAERVLDLAQFLQYHAHRYEWYPRVCDSFLQAYDAHAPYSLHLDEWKLFYSHLAFPRRLHTRMHRYFGREKRRPDHLLKLAETVEQEQMKESYLHTVRRFIRQKIKE